MYNEQLENLIEMALLDGELTEKEKQVLFKKAESFGIDLDEFEMVLEAKLFEKNKNKTSGPITSPKSNKFGDIKKCPACGAIAQSFQTRCNDCGHDFSNIAANSSIQQLFQMLDTIESQRNDKFTSGGVMGQFASAFGVEASKTDKRKKEVISSFPVPNTKEDILEFLSLAFPNAKIKGNLFTKNNPENIDHNNFVPIWLSKCEQIIMKARFSMKEDRKTLDEINQYAKELKIK